MATPRKLPSDAFEHYLGLGVARSYQAVAEHYSVTKATVTNRAKREGWQDRVSELERMAREQFEQEARSELKAVRERHLKGARALQGKALEALRDLPPERAVRVASALSVAWKHELLILGEPTERTANVEEVTRREMRELLVGEGEVDNWSDGTGRDGTETAQSEESDGDPKPDAGDERVAG